jgi:nitrite reductase/ring-hydroxylating ferredoxin subunit
MVKHKLCRISDIDPEKGLILPISEHDDILLVLYQGSPLAYLNRCPHAHAKLHAVGQRVLAIDGFHIFCSVHGAHFHPATGRCQQGPCPGHYLTPITITCDDEWIWWDGQLAK